MTARSAVRTAKSRGARRMSGSVACALVVDASVIVVWMVTGPIFGFSDTGVVIATYRPA